MGLADDEPDRQPERRGFYPARAIGVVDTCERRLARARAGAVAEGGTPGLVIGAGYCHWFSGPLIVVSDLVATGPNLQRMMGERFRNELGDLLPVPSEWRDRVTLDQVVRQFVAVLRARSRHGLARLLGTRPEHDLVTRTLTRFGPVVEHAQGASQAQTSLWVSRYDSERGTFAPHGYEAWACFCREGRCDNRWPLAIIDADAAAERPYACVNIRLGDWPASEVEVSWGDEAALPEPET